MARPVPVVLGIDSGTQSTRVLAVGLDSGEIVAEGRAPHSGESVQDPREWWAALRAATAQVTGGDFEVRGLSIGGQQHGCVLLDESGATTRWAGAIIGLVCAIVLFSGIDVSSIVPKAILGGMR